MYPLALLTTTPENLEQMERALQLLDAFMKNTLIRGLNNLHQIAPTVAESHPQFQAFMKYTTVVLDMIVLHLDSDKAFFTKPTSGGKALADILGPKCNPSLEWLKKAIEQFVQKVHGWAKAPKTYTIKDFQASLNFGDRMLKDMSQQVDSMKSSDLEKNITHDELHRMITDHLAWLSSYSGLAILLPFVVSHHDPKTSTCWPGISPQGKEALQEMVKQHEECWKFAPINPLKTN